MFLKAVLSGFFSGYLAGQFGVGGGIITTPLLRLWLGLNPNFSIGTTLPPIIPGALLASYNFYRAGFRRFFEVKNLAFSGVLGVLLGSSLVTFLGGKLVMLLTSIIVILVSISFILKDNHFKSLNATFFKKTSPSLILPFVGLFGGIYSALFGLGGGFVLIPSLVYFSGLEIKEAIATSLMTMPFLVLPATLTHFYLGNIDWLVALGLLLGVLPGSLIGSKVALKLQSTLLEKLFGFFLFLVGIIFLVFELGVK